MSVIGFFLFFCCDIVKIDKPRCQHLQKNFSLRKRQKKFVISTIVKQINSPMEPYRNIGTITEILQDLCFDVFSKFQLVLNLNPSLHYLFPRATQTFHRCQKTHAHKQTHLKCLFFVVAIYSVIFHFLFPQVMMWFI